MAATALPGAAAAADALTVTQIAQASTALLTALKRFQYQRGIAFDEQLRKEAVAEAPTLGDVIDNVISREMGFEATFRAKQYARIQAELGPSLAISDPKDREKAVRALFERERRYTQMREEAMRVRVMAAIRHHHLEQASPQGAYWRLGTGVKQHTLDCLAMANQFWPWSVLHAFQPPVHHGCACSLLGLHEAVAGGLMTPDQVPDEMAAIAHATDVLQKAANAMRAGRISEADIETYLAALGEEHGLTEARWATRFAKGTANAGRFRPRVGGDPGAMLLKRLGLGERGKVMHELMPDAHPLATTERGEWRRIKDRDYRIPLAQEWKRQIGGEVYHSPVGTTNVYRNNELLSLPSSSAEDRAALRGRVLEQVRRSRGRYANRSGMPLRAGDGPEAVLAMESKGYTPRRVSPVGPGAWRLSYVHTGTGAIVNAVLGKTGHVKSADWDTAPIPELQPKQARRIPRTFREHTQDAMAWAHELGKEHGVGVRITSLGTQSTLEDHAGFHEHTGETWVGRDVEPDINAAGQARVQGRELTDDEKRGVWASYATTAHEVSHAVNPIHPELFQGEGANLEEALAEEVARPLALARLRAQGQHDVARWMHEHPDERSVKGVYRRQRGALADVLDLAGVSDPADRASVVESLKFGVDPGERFAVLGAMLHQAHPDTITVEKGEQIARKALRRGGKARGVVPRKPSIPPFKQLKFGKGKSDAKKVAPPKKSVWKPPPVVLGGVGSAPAEPGPIPSLRHVRIALDDKAFGYGGGARKGKGDDEATYIVKEHGGDRNHVAEELLANAIYRTLGIDAPVMGTVETPGGPDFAQVPDTLADEPPLPETHRLSTGVIIRKKNGAVVLIEPRNHYGGYVHTFPKGGVEPGLTPQQNALKELWEETGLHAHITGVVGDYKGDTGMTRYYLGVETGGEPTPSDETEAIKTATIKQAAEMLNRDRDRQILGDVAKLPVPKGKFADNFPPTVPGTGLAFQAPEGKKVDLREPSDALARGYVTDALLGNWDFVGRYGDNLRWLDKDTPVRVNHGATFEYRPDGSAKPYGDVPEELWSMLYRGQGLGTVPLGEDDLRTQARKVARALMQKRIDALAAAAPFRDEDTRARVASALKARVKWLRDFGDGKVDLPQPAEGAEARALHADSQKKFPVYPEEHKAIGDYLGKAGREFDERARKHEKPTDDARRIAKRLDAVLNDVRTSADTYAYIGYDRAAGKGLVGQTVKQRSYTLAHTDEGTVGGKTLIRVLLPGGSHAYHVEDAEPGQPDMLISRDARLRITGLRKGEDGRTVADAILLPYERPPALPGGHESWKQGGLLSDWAKTQEPPKKLVWPGDRVRMGSGIEGKVEQTYTTKGGHRTARVIVDGKPYEVPADSLTRLTGEGMASPGYAATVASEDEIHDGGHRWRIETRPLMEGHPELKAMTDGTVIAHYRPDETSTHNFRYIRDRARAREIMRGWASGIREALLEADAHHTGVMVALYPHPSTAKKFAVAGGEDPDALHCTLAFLGHKDELDDEEKLKGTVRDWASRTPPLEGEVSGHGVFTAGEAPVTYLSPDLPGLPAARQDLIDSLQDANQPVATNHGFTPHITLDYADRSDGLPDHGGHKLRFRRAVLKIGDEKHSFPLGGKPLQEAKSWQTPSKEDYEAFRAKHGQDRGVSLKKDDDGFFVHTHRQRSKSYPTPGAIPKSAVKFTESTG